MFCCCDFIERIFGSLPPKITLAASTTKKQGTRIYVKKQICEEETFWWWRHDWESKTTIYTLSGCVEEKLTKLFPNVKVGEQIAVWVNVTK